MHLYEIFMTVDHRKTQPHDPKVLGEETYLYNHKNITHTVDNNIELHVGLGRV